MKRSVATFAVLSLVWIVTATALRAADSCQQTAQDVSRSCQSEAQGDYQLTLAKCDNVRDSAARTACQRQASTDLRDAQSTCQDQFDARDVACDRLGATPYDH